jgi:hypothetical protein
MAGGYLWCTCNPSRAHGVQRGGRREGPAATVTKEPRTMTRRPLLLAALLLASLLLAACGGADEPTSAPNPGAPAADPAAGICPMEDPDCIDTPMEPGAGDAFDSEAEREAAQGMLGLAEDELAPDVRVARRGAEQMMLTEDYRLGRKTVELDADRDGTMRVTAVTVELPEGPETFR